MLKKRSHSDGVIVRAVLKGNRERFDGLVERHFPAVYATALAHTRNSADAEDVAQDTFLSAFTALDRLRAPGRFGPWVITIARNTALKHLRRKKSTEGNNDQEPSNGESPITSAQRKEFGVFLSEAIAELPEGDREAILMHYFSGKSAREVAQALGVSRSAVLKRLERGRARLGKSLLDRLGDEKTVREALSPSIHRVTRGIAAAAIPWEASKSLTAGSVLAASLSVLPKASTVAAGLAGVGFTAVVGWNYLKSDTVDQVEAVRESLAPSRVLVAEQITEDVPEPTTAPIAPVAQEPERLIAAQTVVETAPETTEVTTAGEPESTPQEETTEVHAAIDGFWDFRLIQDGVDMGNFGRVELSGAGGGLQVLSSEGAALDLIQGMVRTGRHLEITLGDASNTGTLAGDFNELLTEIVLEGVISSEIEGEVLEVSLRMLGSRVTAEDFTREEQIEAFKVTLLGLYDKLKAYAVEHNWEYPEDLAALYPRYVSDQSTLESNATRSLIYRRPPSLGFEADIQAAVENALAETDPNAVMETEYYLQNLWGEFFLKKVPVLESVHQELNVHLQVSDTGQITEVAATGEGENDGSVSNVQARSRNASCMNNMKQLGIACKMFENAQEVDLMPPGFRTLYPNFILDVRILTCPGAEPGTESYEFLFPATNAAYMEELARQVEGLSGEAGAALLQSGVPFVLELDDCNGLGGRNIIYLDGHGSFHEDGEWELIVEAYRQR